MSLGTQSLNPVLEPSAWKTSLLPWLADAMVKPGLLPLLPILVGIGWLTLLRLDRSYVQ